MRVVVVALGQDRPAARRADRARGPRRSSAATSTRASCELVNAGARAVPRRGRAGGRAGRGRRRRPAARADRHRGGRRRGRRPRRRRAAARRRRRRAARLARSSTRSSPTSRAGAGAADAGTHGRRVRRDDAAGRHDARRGSRRRSRPASGLEPERDFFAAFSPERVYSGRDLRRPARRTRSSSAAAQRGGRGARPSSSTAAFIDAEVRRDGRCRRGGRAGEARRDDLPRPQHRLRERARAATPTRSASTSSA